MIIGIDVSSVVYGTGVSDYTLSLINKLIKIDTKNTYKLFFTSLRQSPPPDLLKLKKSKNVKLYRFHLPLTLLEILWNRLHLIPIETFIGKCDIFHCSDWTQSPTRHAKTVTTIHDLVPFINPAWQHPKTVAAHRRKMYWASRQCRHFICVSENSKKDLLKFFPRIAPSLVSIIYEAANDKYSKFSKLSPKIQTRKKSQIFNLYGLDKYVLTQSTREPRKNLDRLIEAFNLYRQKYPNSKVELAISGKFGWGNDLSSSQKPWIKVLGYIPQKDMVALHAAAICLAYPSLYEGFGLPLVKSMKVGVPVLSSNTSSLPEIVGKAGILVDPLSVTSISQGLEKILSSAVTRRRLSQKALKQSNLFSWTKTARETLNVYQKI